MACASSAPAGSGAVTFHRLIAEHGSAAAALAALPAIARAAGVENYDALPGRSGRGTKWRRRALAGARLLCYGEAGLSRRR